MTPISYYAACQAGVDVLDTAISPLSWGTSQPPTESMVAALQGTDFDTGLDLKLLTHIKKYFDDIKEKYAGILDPISESIDAEVLLYTKTSIGQTSLQSPQWSHFSISIVISAIFSISILFI